MKRRVIVFCLLICLGQAAYAQETVLRKQESFRQKDKVPTAEKSLPAPSLETKSGMRDLRISPEVKYQGLDTMLYGQIGWGKEEQAELLLSPYSASSMLVRNLPHQSDFSLSGIIAKNKFLSVYGQSRYEEYVGRAGGLAGSWS